MFTFSLLWFTLQDIGLPSCSKFLDEREVMSLNSDNEKTKISGLIHKL